MKEIFGESPVHPQLPYFDWKMGKFGEIDSADTRAGKFPLGDGELSVVSPIGASGNLSFSQPRRLKFNNQLTSNQLKRLNLIE